MSSNVSCQDSSSNENEMNEKSSWISSLSSDDNQETRLVRECNQMENDLKSPFKFNMNEFERSIAKCKAQIVDLSNQILSYKQTMNNWIEKVKNIANKI